MAKPKLYALLVGAMRYPNFPGKDLSLPVSDVRLMASYLQEPYIQTAFEEVAIQQLTSPPTKDHREAYPKGATKANVVQAFRSHLGQAQKGDVVVFYYSGHGIREQTDIELLRQAESDGHLSGLALSEFGMPENHPASPGQTVLLDKEIRYLVHELVAQQGPRVLVIFDACHSGGASKSVAPPDPELEVFQSKQIVRQPVQGRVLEDFLFASDATFQAGLATVKSLDRVLPLGDHIFMSACRDIELAWEGRGNSVFTKNLIETLRQFNGKLSFEELHTRLLAGMQYKASIFDADHRQTPELKFFPERNAHRYRQFLTFAENAKRNARAAIVKSEADGEWRLTRGFMHHLPVVNETTPIQVAVYKATQQDQPIGTVTIDQVKLTYSTLNESEVLATAEGPLVGEVQGLSSKLLPIYVSGNGSEELATALTALGGSPLFELVDSQSAAEYTFELKDRIGQLHDAQMPRVKAEWVLERSPAPTLKPGIDSFLLNQFNQLATWTLLKEMAHEPDVQRPKTLSDEVQDYPVELRLYYFDPAQNKEVRVLHRDRVFTLPLRTVDIKGQPYEDIVLFRAELVNHSKNEILTSVGSLFMNFGFILTGDDPDAIFKNDSVMNMAKKQTVELKLPPDFSIKEQGKSYMPIGFSNSHTAALGKESSWFKLIVSRDPYDIDPLALMPLPSADEELGPEVRSKSFEPPPSPRRRPKQKSLPKSYWAITTYELVVER